MGPLAEAAGVYGEITAEEESAERIARINEVANDFLLGGGQITLHEFAAMTEIERAALANAGERLAVEQALRIAKSLKSNMGEAEIMSVLDNGESAISLALSSLLDRQES